MLPKKLDEENAVEKQLSKRQGKKTHFRTRGMRAQVAEGDRKKGSSLRVMPVLKPRQKGQVFEPRPCGDIHDPKIASPGNQT